MDEIVTSIHDVPNHKHTISTANKVSNEHNHIGLNIEIIKALNMDYG